jgi:hypothetical protein
MPISRSSIPMQISRSPMKNKNKKKKQTKKMITKRRVSNGRRP